MTAVTKISIMEYQYFNTHDHYLAHNLYNIDLEQGVPSKASVIYKIHFSGNPVHLSWSVLHQENIYDLLLLLLFTSFFSLSLLLSPLSFLPPLSLESSRSLDIERQEGLLRCLLLSRDLKISIIQQMEQMLNTNKVVFLSFISLINFHSCQFCSIILQKYRCTDE